MQKQRRLIKRLTIEYSEEESEDSSKTRIHKLTTEEKYLTGTQWEDQPLTSTRSEYLC